MEDNNKANIVFNISGGNNQILPNAIKAEQNFYGDKYIEEMMKAKTKSQEPVLSPETTRLSLYINNGKQSLRAVLRTLIKMYTFAPNFKFGTK